MTNSYVSYNAIDENPEGDSDAILAAADKKRAQAKKEPLTKKKKRAKKKADIEDLFADDAPTAKPKPKSKAKSKTGPKKKPGTAAKKKSAGKKSAPDPKFGLLTKGVHAGLRGLDGLNQQAQSMSVSAWAGLAASVMFMVLSGYAWFQAPAAPTMEYHLKSFHLTSNDQILPLTLWKKYVSQYPKLSSWCVKGEKNILREPNTQELTHFIDYLEQQHCIAQVNSINMGYVDDDFNQRALLCDLRLRVPAMKIIMDGG
ncbi:MAG: hypothetical protein HRU15_16925, partial [Planctomycetes bacterium]|nr:hypothetical protein [Planctomycetota bacterium]